MQCAPRRVAHPVNELSRVHARAESDFLLFPAPAHTCVCISYIYIYILDSVGHFIGGGFNCDASEGLSGPIVGGDEELKGLFFRGERGSSNGGVNKSGGKPLRLFAGFVYVDD